MKICFSAIALVILSYVPAAGSGFADYAGVVRSFGDATSWMTSCFVVGDGSWVVTTSDAITEKVGTTATQTIPYPIFISAYSGEACQAELVANNAEAGIALLRIPTKGLPGVELAQSPEFAKARIGTLGELMGDDMVGNRWPTTVYGITREKSGETYKLIVAQWEAKNIFITDMGKYKWIFLSEISPETPSPSGSMVARESSVVGMYLNKLVMTGGKKDQKYGRCVLSTEITRFLTKNGVNGAMLTDPPKPTVKRDKNSDTAFQLYGKIYSFVGSGRAALAIESVKQLSSLRPQDAEVQLLLGVALTSAGKFEDGLKAFDEAEKLSPKLHSLRTSRALALVGLNKRDQAEADLLKAIGETPGDSRPVTVVAEFYLGDEKTFGKALNYAKKASSMRPNSPSAYLLLAKAQKRNKDYKAAIEAINAALKLSPVWPTAYYALGTTYEESGDNEAAEKAYRKMVELQPTNPDSLLTFASFLVDQSKTEEANALIAKVRSLNPPKEVLDVAKALEDKINGSSKS